MFEIRTAKYFKRLTPKGGLWYHSAMKSCLFAAVVLSVGTLFGHVYEFDARSGGDQYELLAVTPNWSEIATGVLSLDDVTPGSAELAGNSMTRAVVDPLYVKRQGGSLFAQYEEYAKPYLKCVKVEFVLEGSTLKARSKEAKFRTVNDDSESRYDMDGSGWSGGQLAPKSNASGYGVQVLRFEMTPPEERVLVTGAPYEYGEPDPGYGDHDGYTNEFAFINATCPATWTSPDGSQSADCAGWKLYTYDIGAAVWTQVNEGEGTAVEDLPHPGAYTKLEWQWAPRYACTAKASGNGTVSTEQESLPYGGVFEVTATPNDADTVFAMWTGVPRAQRCENPLRLTVKGPQDVTAVFVARGGTATWTGAGADNLASTPANWQGGVAPTVMQTIVLSSGSKDITWDLDLLFAGWTQDGYTGTVTFDTVFPDAGLGEFTSLDIVGDVTLNSGTWTHLNNTGSKSYRLAVKVAGDMTIGPNATIHADNLGYQNTELCSKGKANGTGGGSYGGHGGHQTATSNSTYGSYAEPADELGGGGNWSGQKTYDLSGGGAIKLEVGGLLTHNGRIRANGLQHKYSGKFYYLGAGGGIGIVAGRIAGTGTLTANSADGISTGGGGRIAVRLTAADADFSAYDIVHRAQAVAGSASTGGPGTIYAETAADEPGEGWLILKGNNSAPQANKDLTNGDPFTPSVTTLHFAKLTLTNRVTAVVRSGNTFDLRGTEVVAADKSGTVNGIRLDDGGAVLFDEGEGSQATVSCTLDCRTDPEIKAEEIVCTPYGDLRLTTAYTMPGALTLDGGKATLTADVTVAGDLTVGAGGTLVTDAKTTVCGSMTVEAGGTVTHDAPNLPTDDLKKVDIDIAGDLTIEAGGLVHANGKGYSTQYSPAGKNTINSVGGSHGGLGWRYNNAGTSPFAAYGSIVEPVTAGSGSSHQPGAGVIRLAVGGTFRNDGTVQSRSGTNSDYSGASGSIWITAARLTGEGAIDVTATPSTYCATGSGRIAVTLTDPAADFSAFDPERITAAGNTVGGKTGGAGTIYLRSGAQAADEGTLIIRSNKGASVNATPLGGDIAGTAFGSVVITNGAKATLAANSLITVKGDWLNFATFAAGAGSTVDFAGAAPSRIVGDTTFAALSSSAAGKAIAVAPGAVVTVTETLSLSGAMESMIDLGCAEADGTWNLVNSGATTLTGVRIAGCQATNPITVINGADGGGNSDNVTFVTILPGETITWTGAEDSSWSKAANWDRNRAPIATDNIDIAPGAHPAELDVGLTVASLTVSEGAALALGNRALTTTGDFIVRGACTAAAGGSVTAGGAVELSSGAALQDATLVLNGAAGQALAVADGVRLGSVTVLSPELEVSGPVDCTTFTVGDGEAARTVTFAAGASVKATDVSVRGADGRLVTLCGADGAAWGLSVSRADIAFAAVSGSDASKGVLILPKDSVDNGGNVNWMFVDTRLHWDGVSPTTAGDDVVIDAGSDFTIDAAREMKSLTVASGAKLTVNAALAVAGSVTVEGDATLVWNRPGTIGGNLTMLSGATLTHTANTTEETNKISLDIAGTGYIQENARIDAKGCGYTSGMGPGAAGGNVSGSHGGRGFPGQTFGPAKACYGSIVCPTNCGSGGGVGSSATARYSLAGGAVRLAFGGALTLDGTVDADGRYETVDGYYTGAGGSVWLTAASLAGKGTVSACGGLGTRSFEGGGGRIALWLTDPGSDFSKFTGAVRAEGGKTDSSLSIAGSAGTVFRKTAGSAGTVQIVNGVTWDVSSDWEKNAMTDFPSSSLCEPDETKGVAVEVGHNAVLNLTRDTTVSSIAVLDASARILLNGHVLSVTGPCKKSERDKILSQTVPGEDAEGNPGRIDWIRGLMLIVR